MADHVQAPGQVHIGSDDHQFRLLVQSITDYAIYMLDPDGFISNWNAGGQRIKGYTREEIVGEHFSRFYSEEDRAAGLPALNLRTARDEGRTESEGWRYRKDGSRFRASIVIDPIWSDGALVGYAKITRDITARYEAEERLADARRALAQTQKNEAIGKLTYGLAHDFNNLLTVIVNSLDMILVHRMDEARVGKLVEGALRAADRGTLLTRQLLAFARGQKLAPERHDLSALLSRSEALYRRACDTSMQLDFDLAHDLPQVLVDATMFEAAILNLVVNSRDAMDGSGRIAIATHLRHGNPSQPQDTRQTYVCTSVSDNGHGMSEEVRERATEPFFTTKEVGKGSGLGLSQVYGFAAQSGGFVELHSEPGEGTVVSMCLPSLESEEATGG